MTRIWRYVLSDDSGMAPCTDHGVLSLSCCKPMIRKYACVGDWVIGFAPTEVGRGQVSWVGQITTKLSLGEYEKKHSGRRDAIYRLVTSGCGEQKVLVPLRDDYHTDPQSRSRDLKGENALIFQPFWYWGASGILAPDDIADLAHYYVGQSTKNSSPERVALLEKWARSVADPGIHGEPRIERRLKSQGNWHFRAC